MSELITSGQLLDLSPPPVPQQTLVAGAITKYLEQEQKTLNESVLNSMLEAFKKSVTRQLMSTRDKRKGYESCTVYSGKCARKSRLQYDGVAGEPIQARSVLKFILGDLVELAVIGVAQMAGVNWTDNNRGLFLTGKDGVKVNVHPDGMVVCETGWCRDDATFYNGEIKSCDSRTFDKWLEQGGPGDDWGYLTQASVEVAAWREAGYDVDSTCFVAVSTGSRQGSIAEWIIPYDQKLVDAWHDRRQLARGPVVPPVPFEAEPELEYKAGKLIDATEMFHGEPKPRVNAKGAVYGWDVPTGRSILPMMCSYCSYKSHCWPGAELDVKGGKPVWVTPPSKWTDKPEA